MAKAKYQDPQGRHVRIYHTLLNCPAWRVLGPSAVKLFIDLRATVTGTNNGTLSATLADLKHRGWNSSATLAKALSELRTLGFIAVTRAGGLKMGTRVCTLYRFTDLETFESPKAGIQALSPTNDYLKFLSVQVAEKALASSIATLRSQGKDRPIGEKNLPIHKMKRIDSESESMGSFIASETEVVALPSLQ